MTEDILFDNIYIGHSVADAKAFAAETFDIKKPLETAADKLGVHDDDDGVEAPSFKDDPIAYIRQTVLTKLDPAYIREKILTFVELAKLDPIMAFKTHPETGSALAVAIFTLFGMLGAVFGLVGGQQKPITKVSLVVHWTCWLSYMCFFSVNEEDRRDHPR
jgi:hypothetical protein